MIYLIEGWNIPEMSPDFSIFSFRIYCENDYFETPFHCRINLLTFNTEVGSFKFDLLTQTPKYIYFENIDDAALIDDYVKRHEGIKVSFGGSLK